MKILIGGVPFGRNNVGDEAILACVVRILRAAAPAAELVVSTDDPATAARLGVRTLPLFAFGVPYDPAEMARALQTHDVFFWAGATGLSDYPESAIRVLGIAQAAGRRTIVWNVGMNDELNPAFFRLQPGLRRRLLECATRLTFGAWNAVAATEQRRETRVRAALAKTLDATDLLVVRDPESREQVLRSGVTREVVVGADSALLLEPSPLEKIALEPELRALLAAPVRRIGLCVSAQRALRHPERLIAYLDGLVAMPDVRVVFIPMNPQTDASLMAGMRQQMRQPERALVLGGRREPEEIMAVAAKMDVLISSRLHLLIFASSLHVPIIGISRGSKVDNFLAPFGLRSVGSVENCDFAALQAETLRLLETRPAFVERSRRVRDDLLARLAAARERLPRLLNQ